MKLKRAIFKSQHGFGMLETVIALGLLMTIGVALINGMGVAFRAERVNRVMVQAENLTRAQLEDIRNQTYLDSYSVTVSYPAEYSITIDTEQYCTPEPCTPDNNIQQNTVTVYHDGEALVTVSDLKTRR